ncbi:MAG TPA: polyhydroxyalkanoate depolymerase [Azospirillaceae bacterium]|nr:polyhydroxyalkanoate depolymerase [Azospirillaceae bacterium]
MLYQLYDLQHAALAPMRFLAEATQATFQHPLVPAAYTQAGRAIAAGAELLERVTRRFGKPEFGLPTTVIDGREVAVTERDVLVKPFCTLKRFERATDRGDPKLLVVAPLSGHYATLLRGTVEALLPAHDVYITDWVNARNVPLSEGPFGLDDYIAYVIEFLRHLGPNTHVLAVCQPAVPVLAAVSLLAQADDPCQPATMTLMGGPIDTTAAPTQPTRLAEARPLSWFERTVVATVPPWYPGAFRKVYPGFIQLTGFMSMNLDRHVDAHVNLFRHLVRGDGEGADAHRKFYDEYLSVMDLPADYYLQTVQRVFQEHHLPKGCFTWRGIKVEPQAIRKTGLMTVEGELDDISAVGQTSAAHRLCSGIPADRRVQHLQKGVGHYGIFNGRKWREEIMPRVRDFIRANDGGEIAPAPLPAAAPAIPRPRTSPGGRSRA